MKTLARRFVAPILAAWVACCPALSRAMEPTLEETSRRAVIEAQFEAFAQDDADKAFELATPGVRKMMGSSGMLLALVRGSYPMVYRPVTITYLRHRATEEGPTLQLVQVTDQDGKSWLAIFTLERQDDASWRISGCMVAENTWRSA